jgi:hypothetical protein
MAIEAITLHAVECDVCGCALDGGLPFDTPAAAADAARDAGWLVTPSLVVCPHTTPGHSETLLILMPPDPEQKEN